MGKRYQKHMYPWAYDLRESGKKTRQMSAGMNVKQHEVGVYVMHRVQEPGAAHEAMSVDNLFSGRT